MCVGGGGGSRYFSLSLLKGNTHTRTLSLSLSRACARATPPPNPASTTPHFQSLSCFDFVLVHSMQRSVKTDLDYMLILLKVHALAHQSTSRTLNLLPFPSLTRLLLALTTSPSLILPGTLDSFLTKKHIIKI